MATKIINFSLETGCVPTSYKSSRIRPLLKRPGLDQKTLENIDLYQTCLKKVVSTRIEGHLT